MTRPCIWTDLVIDALRERKVPSSPTELLPYVKSNVDGDYDDTHIKHAIRSALYYLHHKERVVHIGPGRWKLP